MDRGGRKVQSGTIPGAKGKQRERASNDTPKRLASKEEKRGEGRHANYTIHRWWGKGERDPKESDLLKLHLLLGVEGGRMGSSGELEYHFPLWQEKKI